MKIFVHTEMQTLHIETEILWISSFATQQHILSTHNSIFHSIHTCLLPLVCLCSRFDGLPRVPLSSRYSFLLLRWASLPILFNGNKCRKMARIRFWWWKRRHIRFFWARMRIYTITEHRMKAATATTNVECQFIANNSPPTTVHIAHAMKKSCEHTCWIFKCCHCGVHKH